MKSSREDGLDSKATGPQTEQGKQRSSRNAIKHGVFSKVIILKDESRTEYDGLLTRLWAALGPEGALEELLVEKLVTNTWRQRRLLSAECAEIQMGMEFAEWDQRNRDQKEAAQIINVPAEEDDHGLIRKVHNPDVLEHCLELLAQLRKQVADDDFNQDCDTPILEKIYGDRDENRLREDLYDSYESWLETSQCSKEERECEGYDSPAQCRKNFLQELGEEICRLKHDQKARSSVQTARTQLEIVSRNVPDSPGLDRLLRYEASLERSFDRTLSQLERLQRMRLGQPVLPKLEVRHSLS
jgi:hypothetical protein